LSGEDVLAAVVPPQALRATRTARLAAAVCTLFLAFMMLPFNWRQGGSR
jgi:hypothetical protein